ncbi:hypothetical protein CBR_g21803 [Chara braunii]|uniref:CASP-like protein n=1 Tax=Chara braunii TaxID=69332 RepID=A0A388JUH8_CHABU|nr:hypothetical protein CBR_g21803 [Chara braunii]|eukprot:GBG61458.1 hypothetical protein CBR_g21803 [Chara braunii]
MASVFRTEAKDYGGPSSRVDGPHVGVVFILRFLQFLFCLIAFGVMISARGKVRAQAEFTDYGAFIFLVIMMFLALIYTFIFGLMCLIKACTSNKYFSHNLLWTQLVIDGIFAHFMFAATCASAGVASQIYKDGTCKKGNYFRLGIDNFCQKTQASTAMGFFATFAMFATHWWFITATHKRF